MVISLHVRITNQMMQRKGAAMSLDFLYLDTSYRKKGFGTEMMRLWEEKMAQMGYKYVMTSTQADEDAWGFYEKLGYRRVGGFFPPEQDAEEWMFVKRLGE